MIDAEMEAARLEAIEAVKREAGDPPEVQARRRTNLMRWLVPESHRAEEKK